MLLVLSIVQMKYRTGYQLWTRNNFVKFHISLSSNFASSPVHCFSPGLRFAEALFVVSRLDSKGAKECGSFLPKDACNLGSFFPRTHVSLIDLVKSFTTNIWFRNLVSIQPRGSPTKFAKRWLDRQIELGQTQPTCNRFTSSWPTRWIRNPR